MKEFIVKYWWILLIVAIIFLSVLSVLFFYKKDLGKSYIWLSGILLLISGIATVTSFLVLQNGLKKSSDDSNKKTRKEIINSVNDTLSSISQEQNIALDTIKSKIGDLDYLIGETKTSLKILNSSTRNIERISNAMAKRMIHSELTLSISYIVSEEIKFDRTDDLHKKVSSHIEELSIAGLEIKKINATYTSSLTPFINAVSPSSQFRNSYTYDRGLADKNIFGGEVGINYRMVLTSLSGQFEDLQKEDSLTIAIARVEPYRKLLTNTASISLNDGTKILCELISRSTSNTDAKGVEFKFRISTIQK